MGKWVLLNRSSQVWMDGEGWWVGVHWAVVTWQPLGPEEG